MQSMFAVMMLRVGSEFLHAMMGGFALFCLYYAGKVPDPDLVRSLIIEALKWGGLASVIVYCKGKYFDG
jgi:hypothetical protein